MYGFIPRTILHHNCVSCAVKTMANLVQSHPDSDPGHMSQGIRSLADFFYFVSAVFLDSFTTGRNYFLMAMEEIVLSYPSKQNSF